MTLFNNFRLFATAKVCLRLSSKSHACAEKINETKKSMDFSKMSSVNIQIGRTLIDIDAVAQKSMLKLLTIFGDRSVIRIDHHDNLSKMTIKYPSCHLLEPIFDAIFQIRRNDAPVPLMVPHLGPHKSFTECNDQC